MNLNADVFAIINYSYLVAHILIPEELHYHLCYLDLSKRVIFITDDVKQSVPIKRLTLTTSVKFCH